MKRSATLLLVCGAILVTTIVSLYLATPFVHASGGGSSSLQMLSGTFTDKNLPVDGITKITLISIPFSVSATSNELEATSFIDVNQNGAYGYAICEMDVDSIAFFSVNTNVPGNSTNVDVGLTSTANGIKSGSHVFTVLCLGYSQYGQGSYSVHSRGTSIIVK